jgi:hypothetical protein
MAAQIQVKILDQDFRSTATSSDGILAKKLEKQKESIESVKHTQAQKPEVPMNKFWKIVMLVFAQIMFAEVVLSSAVAQSMLAVEPPTALVNAKPGQVVTFNIKVGNPRKEPTKVRISMGDWKFTQAGNITYQPVGTVAESASPWTTLSANEIDLPGNAIETVRYTVKVPADAKSGTHWAMIFFSSDTIKPQAGLAGTAMSMRVAHTFYVNVGEITRSGKIAGIFNKIPADPNLPLQMTVQYQNTGNSAQNVGGKFEVRDSSGKVVISGQLETKTVLPNATRMFTINLPGPIPAGTYTMLAILNYGDKETDVAGETSFKLKVPLLEPPTPK